VEWLGEAWARSGLVIGLVWFLDRWFSLWFMVGRELAVGSTSIVLCLGKWESDVRDSIAMAIVMVMTM